MFRMVLWVAFKFQFPHQLPFRLDVEITVVTQVRIATAVHCALLSAGIFPNPSLFSNFYSECLFLNSYLRLIDFLDYLPVLLFQFKRSARCPIGYIPDGSFIGAGCSVAPTSTGSPNTPGGTTSQPNDPISDASVHLVSIVLIIGSILVSIL